MDITQVFERLGLHYMPMLFRVYYFLLSSLSWNSFEIIFLSLWKEKMKAFIRYFLPWREWGLLRIHAEAEKTRRNQ